MEQLWGIIEVTPANTPLRRQLKVTCRLTLSCVARGYMVWCEIRDAPEDINMKS